MTKWKCALLVVLVVVLIAGMLFFFQHNSKEAALINNVKAAETEETSDIITSVTTTGAKTDTDLWQEVRDCNITSVAVLIAEGELSENSQSYEWNKNFDTGWGDTYEKWALYVFNTSTEAPTLDLRDNEFDTIVQLKGLNLESFPVETTRVAVYNENGFLGTNYPPDEKFDVGLYFPERCKPIISVEWTPQEDLVFWKTVTYENPMNQYEVKYDVYLGRELSFEEIRSLKVISRHQEAYLGGVYSAVKIGPFFGNEEDQLVDRVYADSPNIVVEKEIPINREIVVIFENLTQNYKNITRIVVAKDEKGYFYTIEIREP